MPLNIDNTTLNVPSKSRFNVIYNQFSVESVERCWKLSGITMFHVEHSKLHYDASVSRETATTYNIHLCFTWNKAKTSKITFHVKQT